MRARVADGAFHARGDVNHFAQMRLGIVDFFEVGNFHGVFHGGCATRNERHKFCHFINFRQWDFHHTRHITQRGF